MPPEELFSRDYTDRFIEVTGNDGNTYYVYNERNTFGSESLYTISNINMNQTIIEDYSKLPFKTLEGDNDLDKGKKLAETWIIIRCVLTQVIWLNLILKVSINSLYIR